jgi:hypothetical protein
MIKGNAALRKWGYDGNPTYSLTLAALEKKGNVSYGCSVTAGVWRLGVHLIETHNFFQGKESQYRIDPETAIKMLRLAPK